MQKNNSFDRQKIISEVDLRINELYKDFENKINNIDDGAGDTLAYWYHIVKQMALNYPLTDEYSTDTQVKEFIYGNYDEYKRREDLIDATNERLENFSQMRVYSFGKIYTELIFLDKKITSILTGHKIEFHKIENRLKNELARAKARTYGAIKFALSENISKDKIFDWFPKFVDDEELIKGINPFDSLSKRLNIDLPTSTPQYELSDDEKVNIPEWYSGPVDNNGSVITDKKTGEKIELTGLETSIYSLVKTNNLLIIGMQEDLNNKKIDNDFFENPLFKDMRIQLEKGKLWLKEKNIKAYRTLF